jgi:hypothetical protein
MRPGKDRAIVVSFDTSPELVAALTDDQVAVTKAIRDLRPGAARRCTMRSSFPAAMFS